jgi:hypothetical protein
MIEPTLTAVEPVAAARPSASSEQRGWLPRPATENPVEALDHPRAECGAARLPRI